MEFRQYKKEFLDGLDLLLEFYKRMAGLAAKFGHSTREGVNCNSHWTGLYGLVLSIENPDKVFSFESLEKVLIEYNPINDPAFEFSENDDVVERLLRIRDASIEAVRKKELPELYNLR